MIYWLIRSPGPLPVHSWAWAWVQWSWAWAMGVGLHLAHYLKAHSMSTPLKMLLLPVVQPIISFCFFVFFWSKIISFPWINENAPLGMELCSSLQFLFWITFCCLRLSFPCRRWFAGARGRNLGFGSFWCIIFECYNGFSLNFSIDSGFALVNLGSSRE